MFPSEAFVVPYLFTAFGRSRFGAYGSSAISAYHFVAEHIDDVHAALTVFVRIYFTADFLVDFFCHDRGIYIVEDVVVMPVYAEIFFVPRDCPEYIPLRI